jgi:hypothetical protein
MPSDLGRHVVLPWLNEFQARYPGVKLRLQLTDRLANIYREPVDIALRFGVQPESSMVALPLLAENRRVLCASPAYLARRGVPASPRELEDHNCLCFMLDESRQRPLALPQGQEEIEVAVQGDRVADDSEIVKRWALAGLGICYRSRIDVHADLASGRLRLILPEWEGVNAPLTMLVANRKQLSPAVRVLREFLLEPLPGPARRLRAINGAAASRLGAAGAECSFHQQGGGMDAQATIEQWQQQLDAVRARAAENGAHAGVVPFEQARDMKGLDIMQALLEGRFPYPPIAETLDFHLIDVSRGQATFQGTPLTEAPEPDGHRARRLVRHPARLGGRLRGADHARTGPGLYDGGTEREPGARRAPGRRAAARDRHGAALRPPAGHGRRQDRRCARAFDRARDHHLPRVRGMK